MNLRKKKVVKFWLSNSQQVLRVYLLNAWDLQQYNNINKNFMIDSGSWKDAGDCT